MLLSLEKIYIISFHVVTGLYLAGGILIAMAQFLKVTWSQELKRLIPLWKKFSLLWPLLFIPLFLMKSDFYPTEEMGTHKETFLMTCFLLLRASLYSLGSIWANQEFTKRPALSLILFFVIGTFVSIDWAMSLEAHWASNIYGLMYLMNFVFGFFALLIYTRFRHMGKEDRKDLSHILIAAAIAWGYLQYSQYIILWMGNKPKEVWFYLERSQGGFSLMLLILLLKMIPVFGVSFFPEAKTKSFIMEKIAVLVMVGTWLEVIWLVGPPLELTFMISAVGSALMLMVFFLVFYSQRRRLL